QHDPVVATGGFKIFAIPEGRAADGIRQIHVGLDKLQEEVVSTQAKELGMEEVVGLMYPLEISAFDRRLILAVNRRQTVNIGGVSRQVDAKRRLALKDLADLVNLPHLFRAEPPD